MTNEKLLEDKIQKSGKKKNYLAEKIGLTPQGFRNCIANRSEFKTGQIQTLCRELNISTEEMVTIFFAPFGAF